MKRFRVALSFALLWAIPAAIPAGSAPSTPSVLTAARQVVQSADFRAIGHLVRVDAAGTRTSYGITIKAHWFPGVLRVILEVSPPSSASPGARAHILLEMRPNGQNMITIAHPGDSVPAILPFVKWSDGPLGPGFSYEDFLESQYFWPTQTVTEGIKYGARDCDILDSTPGPTDRTHYAGIKTWLDQRIAFPVYVEKTPKGTGAVKEFTYFGLRQVGGVWSASQIEAKLRGSSGSTLLIVDRGSAKANLTLGDFSPEHLTRF
ncbi:MAG: outer membrane lipoprotein-sorting protein [Terracidiphilus sp.]|jgi:hypothetical protein